MTAISGDWLATTLFVVNGCERSRARGVWEALIGKRPELRTAPCILETDGERAREALDAQLTESPERVIAVGGDGTFHLVGNRLLAYAGDVELGLLPAGTGSDLARNLRLSRQPARALEQLVMGRPGPMDALDVSIDASRRWVLNDLSMGLSAAVVRRLSRGGVKHQGSYITAALAEIVRYRAPEYRILIDGETVHEGPLLLAAISNGSWFGNGLQVAPDARVDDGCLDLTWSGMPARWRLPGLMFSLMLGRHQRRRDVGAHRGSSVRVTAESASGLEVDGEALVFANLEATLRPGALRVIYPLLRNQRPV